MIKGTRNIGRAILAFALVGAVGFSAIACKTDVDGNGTTIGGDKNLAGTVSINPSGTVDVNTLLAASYDGAETGIALTYQWKSGTTAVNGATNNTYTPTVARSYTVTVKATGYKAKDSNTVTVIDESALPDLSGEITISPSTGVLVNQLLTANYSGSESVSYQWKESGNAIPNATNKTYTPTTGGSYTVTVTATGYKSKDSDAVIVLEATQTDPATGLRYLKSGNAYILTGRDKTIHSGDSLIVPDMYKGLPVTEIESRAFSANQLTKVTLGNKVQTIGNDAFYYNSLTTITIGANVVISNGGAMGYDGPKFLTLYNGNGKKKGTYNYSDGVWTSQE